jgi:rubrerythrin
MSDTKENLKTAFAGESQANRTYIAFAKKADEEGFKQIAKLFRAAADSETVHALYHLNAMNGVGSTLENLNEAMSGENYEHTEMYPAFIEKAKEEGNKVARLGFMYAMKVEMIHEAKFTEAAGSLQSGRDLGEKRLFVCQYCGNVEEDSAPDSCPICGRTKDWFKEAL